VRLQTSASLFIAALLASAIVVGCDSTGSSEDPPPDEEGAVSFSLVRTANSDVPSDADSAFVRVWQPNGDFNLVEFVNIPDPGQQTKVSLDVPAEQGYRAGVLAVTIADGNFPLGKELLAHGSSGTFTVQSNDTSQVSLDVRAADLTLEAPESIPPNRTDTIRAVYGINPPEIESTLEGRQSSNPSFDFFDGSILNELSRSSPEDTASYKFEISGPNVSSEDTTYVKIGVSHNIFQGPKWTTFNRSLADSFFPSKNGPSFEIPVVPGSGDDDGTVTIIFSRDGDGWEKTRRVVE
jgi:hypothetical protein